MENLKILNIVFKNSQYCFYFSFLFFVLPKTTKVEINVNA